MLAREVGLSRSVFADRFARYVGVSPMHYLGRWHMQLAIRRLTIPGVSVAGRSRGRLRIRSRFQPRLQEICRCAARLVAKGPVINGGPEMTPVG